MSPLVSAWRDFRDAARAFSPPARRFLLFIALGWAGFGVNQVLFNLYLIENGFNPAFVGRTVALNAIGIAVAALPAGLLADTWGRRRCLLLGAVIDALALSTRAIFPAAGVIYAGSFFAGAGQSLVAISASPFMTEHSTPRERTHLFSAFFSIELFAGVIGNLIGGWVPFLLHRLPSALRPDLLHSYRDALLIGAGLELLSIWPLARLSGYAESRIDRGTQKGDRHARGRLVPIGVNALLVGMGAGLVIPFMNLYFSMRFQCSSAQIGVFFSLAQISTAVATLFGPALARRFGKLRTAAASQLLSLPFLVTLGFEHRLGIAVVAFWLRATLMQASTPLLNTFVMEALPKNLRASATSLLQLLWNLGWAFSATASGLLIQHFGYAMPFNITAVLYFTAAISFYLAFRRVPETSATPVPAAEAVTLRADEPAIE